MLQKIFVLIGFLFVFWSCSSAKKNTLTNKKNFPESWIGTYRGELQIYAVDSIAMKLPMTLDIQRKNDSIYQWKLVYKIKGEDDIRDYELKIQNQQKGLYQINEKNSIVLDATYKNEIFTSFFEVMQTYIVATYTKNNEKIIFEIISASNKNPKETGNQKFENETIPKVTSYLVNGRQRAVLLKVKN